MRCEESCCAPCAMSTYSSLLAKAGSRLRAGIHTFLWDEWSQLGISGITRRVSNWVADPEALLVFTIGASRSEPRLFDEIFDWLRMNQGAVSKQRSLNLARQIGPDRNLVLASLGSSLRRPIDAKRPPEPRVSSSGSLKDLFVIDDAPLRAKEIDPFFARYGYRQPRAMPRGHSSEPASSTQIGFAFRMRELFGVNPRNEIMRYLLLSAGEATALEVTESAGYAKRNVAEALNGLVKAQVVLARRRGEPEGLLG